MHWFIAIKCGVSTDRSVSAATRRLTKRPCMFQTLSQASHRLNSKTTERQRSAASLIKVVIESKLSFIIANARDMRIWDPEQLDRSAHTEPEKGIIHDLCNLWNIHQDGTSQVICNFGTTALLAWRCLLFLGKSLFQLLSLPLVSRKD